MMELVARWPIEDHDMSRMDLIEDARDRLARTCRAEGFHALSHPVFSWPDPVQTGRPELHARLAVADPAP